MCSSSITCLTVTLIVCKRVQGSCGYKIAQIKVHNNKLHMLEPCTGLDFYPTLALHCQNPIPLPSRLGLCNVKILKIMTHSHHFERLSPAPVPCSALVTALLNQVVFFVTRTHGLRSEASNRSGRHTLNNNIN